MEAQTQPQQPGQHPVGLAQPPQPYPQPWPPYPGYPPPQSRRWMPYATLAAIVLAGALIAVAIVIAGGEKSHQAAPSAPTQSAAVPTESTATCKAWRTTSAALDAIPALPDGWTWATPNIDTLISNAKTGVDKALDIFQSKIAADDPPQVVSAAKSYIAAKRTEMSKLSDHSITEADDSAVDTSRGTLNQLCTL